MEKLSLRIVLPNLFTAGNLFCGCLGIVFAFSERLEISALLILLAALLDFLDGFVARAVKGFSEFGKQFDSLADAVTFGVLPGTMLFQFISIALGDYFTPFSDRSLSNQIMASSGFLMSIFSLIRLGIFNIDTSQSEGFKGFPTPANAILVSSIPLILVYQYHLNMYNNPLPMWEHISKLYYLTSFDKLILTMLYSPYFYFLLIVVSSVMLVSRVPLIALKFKGFSFQKNKEKYILIFVFLILALFTLLPYILPMRRWFGPWPFLDFLFLPLAIITYVLVSIIFNFANAKNQKISHEI